MLNMAARCVAASMPVATVETWFHFIKLIVSRAGKLRTQLFIKKNSHAVLIY